jgi:hypothetical protein
MLSTLHLEVCVISSSIPKRSSVAIDYKFRQNKCWSCQNGAFETAAQGMLFGKLHNENSVGKRSTIIHS